MSGRESLFQFRCRRMTAWHYGFLYGAVAGASFVLFVWMVTL